jgi:catechol 2,3-dioxygenase-like lactoylglutathione lyase family enzyme
MCFVAVTDFARARAFYEGVLGLAYISQDDFVLALRAGPISLRLTTPPEPATAPYTVFGWRVNNIDAAVAVLAAKGVAFERYAFFGDAQNSTGVWTAPGGDRVAWFKDPDGNLLSLSQHMV